MDGWTWAVRGQCPAVTGGGLCKCGEKTWNKSRCAKVVEENSRRDGFPTPDAVT